VRYRRCPGLRVWVNNDNLSVAKGDRNEFTLSFVAMLSCCCLFVVSDTVRYMFDSCKGGDVVSQPH
jgi:hypothetical protein